MTGKESPCKVNQVRDHNIVGICPVRGKFKAVGCLFLFTAAARFGILDGIAARAIGVVFGVPSFTPILSVPAFSTP